MIEEAIAYSKKGYLVLPIQYTVGELCSCGNSSCQSKGKHPITRAGLHDASKDQHIIESWWREHPKANIGVRTGAESNLTVIDLDGSKGRQSYIDILHAVLPKTRIHKSPNGHHLLYNYTRDLKQTAGILPGVDVRNDGGYIIFPPSVVLQRYYRVERDHPLADLPTIPSALIKKEVSRDTEYKYDEETPDIKENKWVVQSLKGVTAGQRHVTATRLVGYFTKKMLPRDIITGIMDLWSSRCSPPMPRDELNQTIKNIMNYLDIESTQYEGDDREPWTSLLKKLK